MRNSSIQQMTQELMGHRQDENCYPDRAALIREKAIRLGDAATTKPKGQKNSARSSNRIEDVLERELYKRKH